MQKIMHFSVQAGLAISLLCLATACQHSATSDEPVKIDFVDFHISLTPDIETGAVYGRQKTIVALPANPPQTISFSSGAFDALELFINGRKVDAELVNGELVLPLTLAKDADGLVEITANYTSRPKRGYSNNASGVYTEYFACDWMLCQQENFGDKATVTLELNLPKEMDSIGPGRLIASKPLPNGLRQSKWRSDIAYSPYLYAFAFGDFVTVEQNVGNVALKYMSAIADKNDLLELFSPTADMLQFFEEKAGTPFPHKKYTQLYVETASAQEAVSHSIIGAHWLKPMLSDPKEDWLIAHELAHQWWGNGVTCNDISDFWLNEGITVFMVAAWKEHRWGRAVYEQEIAFAKKRHQIAIDAEMDVPLEYDGEYPSIKIRRSIQYFKGAIFIDHLRSEIGETAFWDGLRDYTARNMGKTVSSRNFKSAFELSSDRDLSALFDQWVY